ncbi:MAG: C1 family peptidase [Acidobacteria bacterium]|nr:C1 family peptidase [Acidobacteriota bacterium]MBI3422116.1 C1 family peptidase [Acidobacteriota bacterium]
MNGEEQNVSSPTANKSRDLSEDEADKPPPPRDEAREAREARRKENIKRLKEYYDEQYDKLGIKLDVGSDGIELKKVHEKTPDFVRAQIQHDFLRLAEAAKEQEMLELAQQIKRFDWRSLGVTPLVRDQGDRTMTCWAHATTAAFESSLMIQRARAELTANGINKKIAEQDKVSGGFKISSTGGQSTFTFEPALADLRRWIQHRQAGQHEKIQLDVRRVVKFVKAAVKSSEEAAEYHENAFKYFYDQGAPLEALMLYSEAGEITLQFEQIPEIEMKEGSAFIKAVAWDYVTKNLTIDPKNHFPSGSTVPPPVEEIKVALLEYGPLVVGMALDSNSEFSKYKKLPLEKTTAPSLVFPEKDEVVELDLPDHVLLLIGWDDTKNAWIVQNSYGTDWGYSCDDPRVGEDGFSPTCGYAYIRYGSCNIGSVASWIVAPLLTAAQEEAMRSLAADSIAAATRLVKQSANVVDRVTPKSTQAASNVILKVIKSIIDVMKQIVTSLLSQFLKPRK